MTRIERILAALDVSMYACPERVWPGVAASYRERQVLLTSESEGLGWLWNAQSGPGEAPRVTTVEFAELSPEWTAPFNVGVFEGVVTLAVSLDSTAELAEELQGGGVSVWPELTIALAFHEGFHFLGDQNDWGVGAGRRSAPYPEPWEPRYLRAALARALQRELLEDAGLGAAVHWQGRLFADHADEVKQSRTYDIIEGSAQYASLLMGALAEVGCEASDDALLATAIAHLDDGFLEIDRFDPGREFYDLGVLSGLLLRRDGEPGWEARVEGGASPVELLLTGLESAAQPDDPDLQAGAKAAVDRRNAEVGVEIEPMLEHLQSPDYTRIVVDMNWIAGSFRVGGFRYLADDPAQTEVLLQFTALLDPPSGVAIDVAGLTATQGSDTPCATPEDPLVLTIPTADLAVAGATATATGEKLTFAGLEVEAATDAGGLAWLCPLDLGGAGGAPAEPRRFATAHALGAPHEPRAL